MRLYIVRHGKATQEPSPLAQFPRPEGYPDDFDRPFMPRGESQAQFLATHLSTPDHPIGLILSSRYPRAIQTASIISDTIGGRVKTAFELEVDHPVSEVLKLMDDYRTERSLVLVGHNPQLGELLGLLAANLSPDELILKTGELVALDLRPGHPVGTGRVVLRLRLGEDIHAASFKAAK